MSVGGIRGLVYSLFGAFMLSTLWVTSLTLLSAPASATALLTEAGTHVLNPFLVGQGFGLSQQTYTQLEAQAKAHPTQPVTLSVLKARVLGSEIAGKSYDDTTRIIYGHVAANYYAGGVEAAFDIPPQLKAVLPNFALFNPDNLQVIPGGPKVSQLPPYLQPFFVFVGLTPATFTQAGHQRLLSLLPWFWLVILGAGVLDFVLNRTEQKFVGLVQGVIHGTWPVVGVILALWVASFVMPARFAPYVPLLGLVSGAFLPTYGLAFVLGLAAFVALKFLRPRQQSRQPELAQAMAGMGMPGFPPAGPGVGQQPPAAGQ
jgi:hypothetical protein